MAILPSVVWNEDNPPGTQDRSQGDNRIREMKTQIREVLSKDHIWNVSGQGETWGYHNKVTFYNQAANPTPVADAFMLFAKDVGTPTAKSELHFIDEDSNVQQLTSRGEFIGGFTGMIVMWSGSGYPDGWHLCDGTDGTPNLLGKFIRGIPTSGTVPGTTGGSDAASIDHTHDDPHTHTMPNHQHITHIGSGTVTTSGSGDHQIVNVGGWEGGPGDGQYYINAATNLDGSCTTSEQFSTITGTASVASISILPSYYELAFLIKVTI